MLICPCGSEIGPKRPGRGLQRTYCDDCNREKDRHNDQRAGKKLYYQRNRELILQNSRNWAKANPEKKRADHLRRWNLNTEKFDELLRQQNHECANCNLPFGEKTPYIDHDHNCCARKVAMVKACGQCIKGLVHNHCNLGAGMLGDNSEGAGRNLAYQLRWEHKIDLSYEEILEALAPVIALKKTRLVA